MTGPLTAAAAAQPGRRGTAKTRAAALSIASNAILIALKIAAGAITGSVAILTEAMHSSIDLLASFVAYFSVREADKPADAEHPYGHAKIENLAAAIEAMLILVGSGVIVYAAVRSLANGPEVHSLGVGIAVIGASIVANVLVSTRIARQGRATDSPALEGDAAHLRTDAATSAAVLVGLVIVQVTGAAWLDPVIALVVAGAIVYAGVRDAIAEVGPRGVAGYHKLRARRAGSRRYVDLHVQFVGGTTLEDAHATAHALQDAIRARMRGADVLIHLEPEGSVHPGTELPTR